jgi:hypothetical protein
MSRYPATAQDLLAQEPGRYESWLSALDALGVQFLILDAERDDKLLQLVQTHPRWALDFSDGESVLFARTGRSVEAGITV